ncbi:Hypothetical_protein [Hexamita inflata]|uniref:Hypothetical_protein n=1 Tax=Hexamita inflata TaxID=28002 RepID=A0AA86TW10_9EUKA|nr:Hypothetical protein HINF_LOCUS11298 [Hexamita inflata]CAI9925643.1 Hypothetical protein HINF_LOCUS13288 [Hexamita inflata]
MIGINVNSATILVKLLHFQPSAFNVGNGSSYLFGSAVTNSSSFMINSLVVILGTSSNSLAIVQISTTSEYYNFCGIIANINSDSSMNVNNVIFDSFQKFNTNYVSYYGFLIGYIKSSVCSIYQECLYYLFSSDTTFSDTTVLELLAFNNLLNQTQK